MSAELYNLRGKEILRTGTGFNNLDPIWVHPETSAKVFVGNQTAAQDLQLLTSKGIRRVVNCTRDIPLYHSSNMLYFRFRITDGFRFPDSEDPEVVLRFFRPVFLFVDEAMEQGQSVLIHCLAGAHRAGSTGVAWIMYKHGWGVQQALDYVRGLRPIVNPLGMRNLLDLLEKSVQTGETSGNIQ